MRKLSIEDINNRKPKNSRLTAIEFSQTLRTEIRTYRKVISLCSCGKKTITSVTDVATGHTLSCGCFGHERRMKGVKKYSKNIPSIYGSYASMMTRCYNKESRGYKYYGAKGVRVCDEWLNSYESFLQWSLKNGWKKGYHLDKDKLGDGKLYSPETCEWMTNTENSKYKRRFAALMFEYNGEMRTLGEICKIENLNESLAYGRVRTLGLSIDDAIKLGNKKYKTHEIKKLLNYGKQKLC